MRINIYFVILLQIVFLILFKKNTNNSNNFNMDIKIYWINLERSKDRKLRMINQFKKFNITNHERIEAVNGKKIKEYEFKLPKKIEKEISKQKNVLGCILSHLKCIKKAYENNDQICMIMEDDICLETIPKWNISLKQLVNEAPKNWEILHLSMSNLNIINKLLKMKEKYIKNNFDHWGTISYLINRKGIEKLYNFYELFKKPNFNNDHIHEYNNFVVAENIYSHVNTYTYTKILFTFINTESTIHKNQDDQNFKGRKMILDYYNVNTCNP